MPNGRPGDHPISDIVVHGKRIYSKEIDELIFECDRLIVLIIRHPKVHKPNRIDESLDKLFNWSRLPRKTEMRDRLNKLHSELQLLFSNLEKASSEDSHSDNIFDQFYSKLDEIFDNN